MMRDWLRRIARLEYKGGVGRVTMPIIIIWPGPDAPAECALVLADIRQREGRGERVVVLTCDGDEYERMHDE